MSPYDADDLTTVIEQDGGDFLVLQSPSFAEHCPNYLELGRFASRPKAEGFLQRLE